MDDSRTPSYYAVLPASVRYDKSLIPNAKLLYAEITALQERTGYCFASNEFLSDLFGLKPATITSLLKNLKDNGYIEVDVVRDAETNQVLRRKIWTTNKMPVIAPPSSIKIGEGSPIKIGEPPLEKSGDNNTSINNIPPKAPQGGRRRRSQLKEKPDHNPERFSRFWSAYPRGENKQGAIRAWDKLQPDDCLCDTMARALKRQLNSQDWQNGIGIPHASTWINQRRWEDEVKIPVVPEMDTRGGLEQW